MTQDRPIELQASSEVVTATVTTQASVTHTELVVYGVEPENIDVLPVVAPKHGTLVLLGVETLVQNFDNSPEHIIISKAQEITDPYNALAQSLTPPVRENRFKDTLIDIVLGNERTKRFGAVVTEGSLDTQYAYALRYTKEPTQNLPSQLEVEMGSWLDNTALDSFESTPAAHLRLQFNHGKISDVELFWKAANPVTILGIAHQTDAGQYLADFMHKFFVVSDIGETTSTIKLHIGNPSIEIFQQVAQYYQIEKRIFDYATVTSSFELETSGPEIGFRRIIEDLPAHNDVKREYGISLEENLSVDDYYKLLSGLLSLLPAVALTWQTYPQVTTNVQVSDLR